MGCTHSTKSNEIVVTTESSNGGANHDHATKIHRSATMPKAENEQEQQQKIQLLDKNQNIGDDNNSSGTRQTAPPTSLHSNGKTNRTMNNNDSYNDDFTTDYAIIKQVMVGMSALSNIYMVMKRPKPTNDDDNDDDEIGRAHV